MRIRTSRLIPLTLILPLLACTIFDRTPTEEPPPPVEATTAIEPSLPPAATAAEPLPLASDTPGLPPTFELRPTEAGPAAWPCYDNEWAFPFTLCYPPDASLIPLSPSSARIDLPIEPDTNLAEKWLEIVVTEGQAECRGPMGSLEPPETVTIMGPYNALDFLRESGGDAGAGNFWNWVSYSTAWGDTCVSLTFTLHSTNPLNYDPPITEFDEAAETAVFDMIMATFYWWG
jgi:hypothetical protein